MKVLEGRNALKAHKKTTSLKRGTELLKQVAKKQRLDALADKVVATA